MNHTNKNMYLLTYDHGGYILWGAYFKERIDSAVNWLEKYPKFKIGLDNEAFAYDQYHNENPEIISAIRDILKKFKGRFAIGSSTYGQPLSVFINEESNVRQITYAIRTNLKYFNETPSVFAISEHALHSQIPQLIKQAGYVGAIMRTHFMMYGYNPTYDIAYGNWIGDDGSSIPTVPTYDGEGSEFAITTMDNWVLTRWPDKTDISLEQYAEKFKHIKPLLASRYDDIILRCEGLTSHVEKIPEYQWITLDEIPELFGNTQGDFKPNANEFKVRMPWGYCGNLIFNHCRLAEIKVTLAERANAASVLIGGIDYQTELEEAWKNLLITQHHDIQICGLLMDESKFIPKSLEHSDFVLKASLKHMADQFSTDSQHNLMVFNPLSWKSAQLVETEVAFPRGVAVEGLRVLLGNKEIPSKLEISEYKGDQITRAKVIFKAEVDGLSANCYSIKEGNGEKLENNASYCKETGILKTKHFEIKLDQYGICSIKKDDYLYVDSDKGTLFAGFINYKNCLSKGIWTVNCNGANAYAVQVGTIGGISYKFDFKIDDDKIHCNVTFSHNGETIGNRIKSPETLTQNTNGFVHEDKLRFILKTTISKDAIGIRDLPFLVETTPDKYVQGNYWMAIQDDNHGIAYLNKGCMCAVREKEFLSLPLAYANDYIWGSRYLFGDYSHSFSVLPFAENWTKADLHKKAISYEYPFATYSIKGEQDGKFDTTVSFISTQADSNIILSALYPEDNGVIARYYEYEGKDGKLSVNSSFSDVCEQVTIMGEKCGNAQDNYEFRGHEIKSLMFKKLDKVKEGNAYGK